MHNCSKVRAFGSSLFLIALGFYFGSTFFTWNKQLEIKKIVVQSPVEASMVSSEFETVIHDITSKNPESVLTKKGVKIEEGKCYNATLEGNTIFTNLRWMIAAQPISCK
jgi:hypothetical protein